MPGSINTQVYQPILCHEAIQIQERSNTKAKTLVVHQHRTSTWCLLRTCDSWCLLWTGFNLHYFAVLVEMVHFSRLLQFLVGSSLSSCTLALRSIVFHHFLLEVVSFYIIII
jgi:hypothetical protein